MSIGAVEFDYLRNLVRNHSAIILDADKEYLAENRLASITMQEGCGSVQELLRKLRLQRFTDLHRKVLDAMTNNETWFFRDHAPYDTLRDAVIPSIMKNHANERAVRIWSAACSSGQEPYSLALLVKENFLHSGWNFRIHATDISNAILERAKRGRYSQLEVNRGMPAILLSKYFTKSGMDWELKPEIRQMVSFQSMNLAEPWPPLGSMDIVLLRNVLIYFDIPVRKEILARLRRVLRPDGYLLLGGAETTLNIDDNFERVQFQKTSYYRLRA